MARRAMEQMGVADLAQRPMSSLSGGLRQRVYLATLWCQDSPFVLLDEPATYLDVGGQRSLMGSLLAMSEAGKGVVAVMHDLPLAFRFCHEIALLWEGRLLSLAEPEALCQSGLLEKVFGVGVKRTSEGGYAYRE